MLARTRQTDSLDFDVSTIRYAHGKRLEGLFELGITTIRNLLEHYPFRYDDFSRVLKIADLPLGEKNAVLGTIHEAKGRKTAKGGFLYEISVTDTTGVLKAIWFNQKWLADTLTVGKSIMLLGKVEHQRGFFHLTAPLYTLVFAEKQGQEGQDHDRKIVQVDSGPNPVGIVPVYRANSKISSNWIKRLVLESRSVVRELLDPLPPALRIKRNLVSRQIAWYSIHTPKNEEELTQAHRRLAYEQVFYTQLFYAWRETQLSEGYTCLTHRTVGNLLTRLREQLPFELTRSQLHAIEEIFADMRAPIRMNRLLLGDVGSGKTVVALHALIAAAESGTQAAMMAPTEVLTQQYAASIGPVLDALGISWTLLSSALLGRERQEAYERIAEGSITISFGTHALIEPSVVFKNLSLIIIDEQHRFGVEHRNSLIAKNPAADFLSMTATPIPRSMALVLYGTIKVSYLENRPQKARVQTINLDSSVSYRAYEAIREAVSRGEQAYIVCPLISATVPAGDEEEQYLDDLERFYDEPYIAAAEAELEHLQRSVFPDRRIELLTSRVNSAQKGRIMAGFKAGEIDILVSTTVIEVGIDVPSATVMVILDANRFGLAQLHQLRGRVGRGTRDAQVFLVSNNPGETARKRLRALEQYTDGLKLAEADLAERREGDIVGIRQHGAGSLSLINVIRDSALIEAAHDDIVTLLKHDPALSLPEHLHLRSELLSKERNSSN